MVNVNLTKEREQVVFGKDSVIIQKYIAGIPGGRSLDVTDITDEVLYAGHPIITDGNGGYKPLKVVTSEGVKSYDSLPDGYSYAGILYRSILTKKPSAAIMISGVVNDAAVEIPYGAHKAAIKSALPTIMFVKDEVADSTAAAAFTEESASASESASN
ncbi:MAG: hypothetical protein IJS13_07050 [Paludibacteraceae bacterium]|nr:hypothetical protein [Paludibacteraceae bacterium]